MIDLDFAFDVVSLAAYALVEIWPLAGVWCLWMVLSLCLALYRAWRPGARRVNAGVLAMLFGAVVLALASGIAEIVYHAGGCHQDHAKNPPTCRSLPIGIGNFVYVVRFVATVMGIWLLPPFLAAAALIQGITTWRRRRLQD
ncbi:MAG: hypothetical protein AAFR44_14980 [Pseudomonadota bacterium]